MAHIYPPEFYEYMNRGSTSSAKNIIPHILDKLSIKSVLDVGCGQGAWLKVWQELGGAQINGLDGSYVEEHSLLIPSEHFSAKDLSLPFELNKSFDLVQSLEVAEHIAEESSDIFVDNLTKHGNIVMFSAAVPGQGGEHHVNEQPYGYWQKKFSDRGYVMYDFLRPKLKNHSNVEYWYRYNTFLFISKNIVDTLAPEIINTRILPDEKIEDYSSFPHKIQKMILKNLPSSIVTHIAKFKHFVVNRAHSSHFD